MKKYKKLFFFCGSIGLILILSILGFKANATEITYPQFPSNNVILPTKTVPILTDYIKYIFNFAIGMGGLIVFASLIYGGVRYTTSAGNVGAMGAAKDRIYSSVLGLILILGGYLILTTINPQLIIIDATTHTKWGIVLYKGASCSGESKEITVDTPDLADFNNKVVSIESKAPAGYIGLELFSETNYLGIQTHIAHEAFLPAGSKLCADLPSSSTQSFKILWRIPGVYLVNDSGKESRLVANTAVLDADYNDKVVGVQFLNTEAVKFGTILHEDTSWRGKCHVYTSADSFSGRFAGGEDPTWIHVVPEGTTGLVGLYSDVKASSARFFSPVKTNEAVGAGVTLCANDQYGGECWGPLKEFRGNVSEIPLPDDSITSVKIEGQYLAILFEDVNASGKCQVFSSSDPNLRDNDIGRCGCDLFNKFCKDCLSSLIIISTK